jgi:hypothetical protein
MTEQRIDNPALEDALRNVAASMLLGIVTALVAAGESGNSALRLAAFVLLEEQFGRGIAENTLGIEESTVRRWRAHLVELSGIPETPPRDVVQVVIDSALRRQA